MGWVLRQVFLSKRKTATYMLSQNFLSVLGFSWLHLCRNQRWMLRTSQSSCLERPSNLFSSGCYETRYQQNHFHLHYKHICPCLNWDSPPPPTPGFTTCYWDFHIYHWGPSPSISSMAINNHLGQKKLLIRKQHWKIRILLKRLHFLSATEMQWSSQLPESAPSAFKERS